MKSSSAEGGFHYGLRKKGIPQARGGSLPAEVRKEKENEKRKEEKRKLNDYTYMILVKY